MVFEHDNIQDFLAEELRRRVQVNPNYSLRSFAQKLKLNPGVLSEVLRGRRNLSLRSIPDIAKAIGLSSREGKHLLQLAQNAKVARHADLKRFESGIHSPAPSVLPLPEDVFSLISEWYHFAILNLLDTQSFQWKAPWIAKRLGISRIQAQLAMDLLKRLSLVVYRDGRYRQAKQQIDTGSESPSRAIRGYHRAEPFTVLRGGIEGAYRYKRTIFSLSLIQMLNDQQDSLVELGDVAGRGTGRHTIAASIAIDT